MRRKGLPMAYANALAVSEAPDLLSNCNCPGPNCLEALRLENGHRGPTGPNSGDNIGKTCHFFEMTCKLQFGDDSFGNTTKGSCHGPSESLRVVRRMCVQGSRRIGYRASTCWVAANASNSTPPGTLSRHLHPLST